MCNGTTHALPSMVNTHGKQQCPVNDVSVFDVHTLSKLVPLCVPLVLLLVAMPGVCCFLRVTHTQQAELRGIPK